MLNFFTLQTPYVDSVQYTSSECLTGNDAIETGARRAATKQDVRHADKDETKHDEQHAEPHVASDATAKEGDRQESGEDDDSAWKHAQDQKILSDNL